MMMRSKGDNLRHRTNIIIVFDGGHFDLNKLNSPLLNCFNH